MTLVRHGWTVYDLSKISDPARPEYDPQLTPSGPPLTHSDFSFLLRIIDDFPFWVCVLCHEDGLLPALRLYFVTRTTTRAVPS